MLLELLSVTRRKGLSCGLSSIVVVLEGLLCSFMEGGKLEKTQVLERGDFFFFLTLKILHEIKKLLPSRSAAGTVA